MYAVHDRINDEASAKNTVYTHIWFWPTLHIHKSQLTSDRAQAVRTSISQPLTLTPSSIVCARQNPPAALLAIALPAAAAAAAAAGHAAAAPAVEPERVFVCVFVFV